MLGSKTTFGVQAPKSPSIRVIQQPKSAQQYRFASVAARPLALAVHLAFASTVITVVGWAPAANAQQDGASAVQAQAGNVRHFDIPAGPLSKALTQFSTEAEIFLVGATDLAQSKSSPGVQGEFSVTAALSQLLAGTGLQARPNSQGQYVLQEVSGATTLPPVKVSADNLGATTEGTGSYTTGSMSSATGLNLSIRETPQTVTVVTRQKMDDFSLNDMEDVIKYTPGATYDSQGSASSFFRLRGSSISAFRVDGLLIDSNSAGGYHDDEYFSALNMSIYDRVEIVKGATGLMEGMGGFGGSVNLIRKRPTKEFQASVQSSVGRWNYYQAGIDLSGSLNESKSIRARGGVAYEDTESFMDYYQRDTTTAFGIVEADITDNTLLTLSVDYQDDNPTGTTNGVIFFPWNADGTLRNPPRSESTTTEWTENPSTQTNAMIDIQHSFNNKWVLKTAYGINKQKLGSKALTWFGNMGVGSDGTLDPAPFAYRDSGPNEVDRENYSISASGPFSALGREHTFSIGLNGSAADSVDKSYWDGSTVELTNYNDRNSIPDASSRQLAWRPEYVTEKSLGLYASARISIADPLALIIGSRVSNWELENIRRPADGSPSTKYSYDYDNEVTPYIGVVYDINGYLSAYASYTSIFNPQNVEDKSGHLLDPIEGKSKELGLKGEFYQGRLNASLAYFDNLEDNKGIFTGEYTNTGDSIYEPTEGYTTKGFEVEVSGEILPGWQMQAGYTDFDLEDADGADIDTHIARKMFVLNTTYDLNQRFTFGGGLRWQDGIYVDHWNAPNNDGITGTSDDRITQKAYTLVDLMARYRFNDQLSVGLNVSNIFDETYYSGLGYYPFYGEPRNYKLTVKYNF